MGHTTSITCTVQPHTRGGWAISLHMSHADPAPPKPDAERFTTPLSALANARANYHFHCLRLLGAPTE